MQLASMRQDLGWGLVYVTDFSHDEDNGLPDAFPEDAEGKQPAFVGSETATVILVQHGSDGDVEVRLWAGADEWGKHGSIELGVTHISIPSGQIRVSDVLREKFFQVCVPSGRYRVQINGDARNNAAEIDLVIVKEG
ncbi:hypothetical protein [Actinoplanes regularis]|uniref:hypothetical protein n=1 Tax=Actinoplanes regularis TaxID=52697 RepID=UPI002552EF01|nr:hypothetical protein [Actinoplanes regularis]